MKRIPKEKVYSLAETKQRIEEANEMLKIIDKLEELK